MDKQKRVLICCANYWNSPIQVGDHQIARQFVLAGWKVGFLSTPISPLHFLKQPLSQDLKDRFHIYRSGGTYFCDDQLWSYVSGALFVPQNKPFLRNKWLYRNWQKLTIPDVKKVIAAHGFDEIDLIYFREPKQAFWLKELKHRASIYRIADHDSGFHSYNDELNKLEQELASSVDMVCYTAHRLQGYVSNLKPKQAFHLPNGVNFRHFSENTHDLPVEYRDLKRPIVVYVGSIECWFDFDLVNFAAKALPEVSFVIIGPEALAKKRLDPLPNINILGRRNYDILPAYLKHADMGIIPFNKVDYSDLVNSINPIKLYEYMSAGLPVLAPQWEELAYINAPVSYYNSQDDFVNLVRRFASTKIERNNYVEYAGKFDWSTIFNTLKNSLEEIHPGLFQ